MKISVLCGSEVVSLDTNSKISPSTSSKERLISMKYNEGSVLFQNQTLKINPSDLTLNVDLNDCPIVAFSLFEDYQYQLPWTNTSLVNLLNGDDPEKSEITIATYEEERYSWFKDFYILATTLGNQSNINDPIHIQVTIIKGVDS